MSALTFSVVDTACEAAEQAIFPPRVVLATVSQTKIATLYGYSEYVASSPPKKYHQLEWTGTAEMTGKTLGTQERCVGIRYVYSGAGVIDSHGNQTANYAKDIYQDCPTAGPGGTNPWPFVNSIPNFGMAVVSGYCWATDPGSCSTCSPFQLSGNYQANNIYDVPPETSFLVGGTPPAVLTSTSFTVNNTQAGLISIENSHPTFPPSTINGVLANWIQLSSSQNFGSVLSDEYTDAEALANALVINSNGSVAENLPRTKGFVSRFTAVSFSLSCSSLVVGKSYIVTVQLRDTTTFVASIKSYNFTASLTSHIINDSVPNPASGHRTEVRSAQIGFAP